MLVKLDVPLGPMTTLRLGGPAARLVEVDREEDVPRALGQARPDEPVVILGGGSNVVVADAGFGGLVIRIVTRGVDVSRLPDGSVDLDVAAGEPWDGVVARAVDEGWSGVECLSGIPGLVGATPIQNVGAYGQEVADTITEVRAWDRRDGRFVSCTASACGFAYRDSNFKRANGRWVVTRVRFRLRTDAAARPVRYGELARALGVSAVDRPALSDVRAAVVALRRVKGMVIDPADPESVSAGSFFTNPIVDPEAYLALEARVAEAGMLGPGECIPRFDAPGGRVKLSAGWLVERAGFAKGHVAAGARVAVSRRHALALVNRGGGTARELLDLARAIQEGVRARFGIGLELEPVLIPA